MPIYMIRTAKVVYDFRAIEAANFDAAKQIAFDMLTGSEEITSIHEANAEGLYNPNENLMEGDTE